jgi:hypothetical protein
MKYAKISLLIVQSARRRAVETLSLKSGNKPKMKNKIPLFVGALVLALTMSVVRAVPIVTFTSGQVTGDGDIITPGPTTGTLVAANRLAYDGWLGNVAFTNGVTFVVNQIGASTVPSNVNGQQTYTTVDGSATAVFRGSQDNLNGSSPIPQSYYTNLSAGYQALIFGGVYGNNEATDTANNSTLTLNNLVVSDSYTVRFWLSDSTANGAVTSETVSLSSDPTQFILASEGGGGTLGDWVQASFVADSTSEGFTFSSSYDSMINGYELLDTTSAVPEPSTVALLSAACGLVGLVAVRRFRLAAV